MYHNPGTGQILHLTQPHRGFPAKLFDECPSRLDPRCGGVTQLFEADLNLIQSLLVGLGGLR